MAIDYDAHGFNDAPPRNGVILLVGVGSCILLLALIPVFHGYFNLVVAEQEELKMIEGTHAEFNAYMNDQHGIMEAAQQSVHDTMEAMGQRGRMAHPSIRPATSDNLAPLEGWTRMSDTAAKEAAEAAVAEQQRLAAEAAAAAAAAAAEAEAAAQ